MSVKTNQKGFTLVEIVIVLAIGALVIAGILIAVAGAQQSRRDTQRKEDTAALLAAVEQRASNNGGVYATGMVTGFGRQDPRNGVNYTADNAAPVNNTTTAKFQIITDNQCGANGALTATVGARNLAVRYQLENGDFYCVDNN